ncbi:MAG: Sec-independent protein translocase subunit TatA [Umezawaea sp.]
MGNLGATELIIIAVVIILLFGAKKLPDMARSLGKSAKILKAETKGLREDDDQPQAPPQQQYAQQPQQYPVQQAPQQLPPAQPVVPQPVVQPQSVDQKNNNN